MKIFFRLVSFALLMTSVACTQAKTSEIRINERYRDSIIDKYLKRGAWQYPYYSKSWEIYVDSALLFLPQDAYLWQQKGMPYFKKMKYQAGMRFLDSAVKYDKKGYLDYRAFMKCIFQKDYISALEDFWAARNINGNSGLMDHPYNFYIGLCHLQLNHFDSAQIYFSSCVEEQQRNIGKDWVHPLHTFYCGIAFLEKEQFAEAIKYFDQSLEQYQHFSDAEYYKALALASQKKFHEAYVLINQANEDFKKKLTINEDNAIYERYPYQVNQSRLESYIRVLKIINEMHE